MKKFKQPLLGEMIKQRWAYYFLLPGLLLLTIFNVYPVVETVLLSFTNYTLNTKEFVGLANFIKLFSDQKFIQAYGNCFKYVLFLVPAIVVFSLLIANVLVRSKPWIQSTFRGAFYLPTVVGGVVIAAVWIWIFHPLNGLFNYVVKYFGGEAITWLADVRYAMPAVCLVVLTWTLGTPIIIFMAGMLGISPELYESATIDGATRTQLFFHITIPVLRPVIVFILTMEIINVFQLWEVVYLLTNGGPSYSTMSIGFLIYNTAFVSGKYGLAAAQGVILTLTILLFSWLSLKASKEV
jgi:multiple sugar transport system permease protein